MKPSLRTRIALSLGAYSLLLSAALIAIGYSVQESLEGMVWRAQLDAEMTTFLQQRAQQSELLFPHSGKLRTYVVGPGDSGRADVPASVLALAPGTHDDIEVEGIEAAVMVRAVGDQRIYMVIDVTKLETEERTIERWLIASTSLGAAGLVLVVWWLSGRLVHPVSQLAIAVDRLQPGALESQRLTVDARASTEVQSIANAMNRLLGRVDELIRRERDFVNTLSHELRTPLAVINGATELASQQPDLADAVRKPLRRISQSVREVEQLVHLLLVLAKSPERLHESDEEFNLDTLLLEIVADHQHLILGKTLRLESVTAATARLRAPPAIVQVAISNLLRNAIENSDRGVIQVSMEPAGVVRIKDSGHGMSPEEISRVFATLARSGGRAAGQGIGLALIARICEHLSWRLEVHSSHDQGTLVVLDLRSSMLLT